VLVISFVGFCEAFILEEELKVLNRAQSYIEDIMDADETIESLTFLVAAFALEPIIPLFRELRSLCRSREV